VTGVADILGVEAAAGRTDTIRGVAARLEDISHTASSIKASLSALDGAQWTGAAADLYRQKQSGDIPHELLRITDSFGLASQTLRSYASELDRILNDARTLARQYDGANETLNRSQRNERAATQTLKLARAARSATTDPISLAHAEAAVGAAARSLSAAASDRQVAEDSLGQLNRQQEQLRGSLRTIARSCVVGLHDASAVGIRNDLFSWADRNIVDGVPGAIVSGVATTVGNFAIKTWDLGKAQAVAEINPSLSNLDRLAQAYSNWVDAAKPIVQAVAVCAMVAAAVVIVFCAPATMVAVLPALSAIGTVTTEMGVGLDGSKTAADGYLYMRGKQSGAAVVNDAVNTGIDVATMKLSPGTDDQVANLKSSLDTYKLTGTSQAKGLITKRVTALQGAELHSLLVTAGSTGAQTTSDMLFEQAQHRADVLLGPVVVPPSTPIVGPFNSITQGPTARVRAHVVARSLAGAR
jgi:hypothetical protein